MKFNTITHLVLVLLALGCKKPVHIPGDQIINNLRQHHGKVKLQEIIEPSWNKLYIVGPYSRERMFDSTLLTQKSLINNTGVSSRDDIMLFVFFDNSELVGYSEIQRGDLSSRLPIGAISKQGKIVSFSPGQYLIYEKDALSKGCVITGIGK